MGGGLAFEDENADKGGEGVQKGQFFADVLIECPLSKKRQTGTRPRGEKRVKNKGSDQERPYLTIIRTQVMS